jgi:hypothetical protein
LKYFITNQKKSKMKKFIAIAIVAASLVACGGSGEKKDGADTAAAKMDTAAVVAPAIDTTVKAAIDTAVKAAMDTAVKAVTK